MKYQTHSDQDMQEFGKRLGKLLQGGEVIELVGDVGAGKTTLTRGIARGMGVGEPIQSPTFTINREYSARDGLMLSHYDFYRLNDPGIMSEELAETLFQDDVIVVIEWGNIIEGILPDDRIRILIESISEDERLLTIEALGPKSELLVGGLA